jgi:hypothetical protein
MTIKDFINACEHYYGEQYGPWQCKVMTGYLNGRSEAFLDAAFTILVKRFSRTHRIAPGPAEIEANLSEIHGLLPPPKYRPEEGSRPLSEQERRMVAAGLRDFCDKLSQKHPQRQFECPLEQREAP